MVVLTKGLSQTPWKVKTETWAGHLTLPCIRAHTHMLHSYTGKSVHTRTHTEINTHITDKKIYESRPKDEALINKVTLITCNILV